MLKPYLLAIVASVLAAPRMLLWSSQTSIDWNSKKRSTPPQNLHSSTNATQSYPTKKILRHGDSVPGLAYEVAIDMYWSLCSTWHCATIKRISVRNIPCRSPGRPYKWDSGATKCPDYCCGVSVESFTSFAWQLCFRHWDFDFWLSGWPA